MSYIFGNTSCLQQWYLRLFRKNRTESSLTDRNVTIDSSWAPSRTTRPRSGHTTVPAPRSEPPTQPGPSLPFLHFSKKSKHNSLVTDLLYKDHPRNNGPLSKLKTYDRRTGVEQRGGRPRGSRDLRPTVLRLRTRRSFSPHPRSPNRRRD